MKRLIWLASFSLLAAACVNISPGATVPPIRVPTVAPINVPSLPPINVPSLPPINIPSLNLPSIPPIGGATLPPIVIPSIPPINIPGFTIPPGSTPCSLVTAAEVGQILGASVTDTSSSATGCAFITDAFATISVSTDTSTDLTGAQFLMGNSAQQTNIGGFPALTGSVLGLPAVYVQKPTSQLQILGFVGDDPQIGAKLVQIATIAVGRMP